MKHNNGFLIIASNALFEGMKLLNLVELPKWIARKLVKETQKSIAYQNLVIDMFILLKWIYVSIILAFDFRDQFSKYFTMYLLIANAFTYFFYHLWSKPKNPQNTLERMQRRYLNLILAIFFSIYGFAVVYHQFYFYEFDFTQNTNFFDFLAYSLGNSFGGYSGSIQPSSKITNNTSSLQLLLSFILVSGVLAGTSISPHGPEKEI